MDKHSMLPVMLCVAILFLQPKGMSRASAGAFTNCAGQSEIPAAECSALVALYNGTNGPNWTHHTNWLATNTPSNWYGVTVSGGHVTQINLAGSFGASGQVIYPFGLSGSIPPELGNLSNLQRLDLSINALSGSIPPELGNLSNLQSLDLYINNLSRSVPLSFKFLTHLSHFYSYDTQVCEPQDVSFQTWKATVTQWWSPGLCYSVSGRVSQASGPLAGVTISNGYVSTQSGADGMYTLSDLLHNADLRPSLADRSFFPESHSISSVEANQTGLDFWALGPFTGCNNQGAIPLAECDVLVALYNKTNGPNWSDHATSKWLKTDRLETWIGLTISSGHVTSVGQVGNNLNGTIPAELGNLPNLEFLALSYNHLSGSIPPELGNLSNLQYLGLSDSPLSGSVPLSFTSLTSLRQFYFNSTWLCEPQDASFQAWKGTVDLDWNSPGLCYSISGMVTRLESPLAGVTIANGHGRSAQSGSNGAYTLTDLPPGSYSLTARLDWHGYSPIARNVTIVNDNLIGQDFQEFIYGIFLPLSRK